MMKSLYTTKKLIGCISIISLLTIQLHLTAQTNFCAVGDILLDRGIKNTINKYGVKYPFEDVKKYFQQSDINFGNLECPVSNAPKKYKAPKSITFNAPPKNLNSLLYAGFNIVSVANNHSFDYDAIGFKETIKNLSNKHIHSVGYAKKSSGATPVIIWHNGHTFAFFAVTHFYNAIKYSGNCVPSTQHYDNLIDSVRKYSQLVDFTIVSLHWGVENDTIPQIWQKKLAHKLIDNGVDIILGQHPHVLQTIETYHNGLILYSLGNFLFDNPRLHQRQAVIFNCTFDKGQIKNTQLIPLFINHLHPIPATKKQKYDIYSLLKSINSPVNLTDSNIIINFKHQPIVKKIAIAENFAKITKKRISFLYSNKLYTFTIPDNIRTFTDAVAYDFDSLITFYTIVKNNSTGKKQIAIIPFDTKQKKFLRGRIDTRDYFYPWKLLIADIDNDNKPDLLVGTEKATIYFPKVEKRLFVYNITPIYIYPKWLGSKIGLKLKLIDFYYHNNKLILLESKHDKKYVLTAKWNGFGFDASINKNLTEKDFYKKYNNLKINKLQTKLNKKDR